MLATDDQQTVDWASIRRFRDTLRGELLTPTDSGYDEAPRVWNWMIDKRPAIIARAVCSSIYRI